LGIVCDAADGGTGALSLVEKNGPYDICFVDWRMPAMDGVTLSRRLKESSGRSVVIMISASEWSDVETDAKRAGVDKFLPKPLFPSAVADAINECLSAAAGVPDSENKSDAFENIFAGRRLLLAEDVEINREIVIALLESTGAKIDCAENGLRAVEMFSANPGGYDMILMDVQMPEMDGMEATRRIRAMEEPQAKRIPIIAMTANVFKEDVEKCLAAGMNAHVGKPLDLDEVLKELSKFA
jgi:CheY-like chemotaxis protein